MKMKKTDIGVVAFMYAVCAFFYAYSYKLTEESKTYPMFTIALLFALTTLYLVQMIINARKFGVESGADEVLQAVKKGVTADEMIEAGKKVRAAGMILSMTVISGLGGKKLWREHALGSARVISAIKPEYVGFLTLMIEPGTEMYDQYNRGEIELLTPHEVLDETELFIRSVDAEGTMFRSNHASNYIPLGGTLNGERDKILEQIEISRRKSKFRPDVFRGI